MALPKYLAAWILAVRVIGVVALVVILFLAGQVVGFCRALDIPVVTTFENAVASPTGQLEAGVEVRDQGALGGSKQLVARSVDGASRAVLVNANLATSLRVAWAAEDELRIWMWKTSQDSAVVGQDLQDDSFQIAGRRVAVVFERDRPAQQ